MVNFCIALLVYLVIGLMIASYETVTSPKFDEEDEKLWNEELGKYMDFPKNPKLYFFCLISLVWPLLLMKKGRNRNWKG
jgi:hypothetical protein